MYLFNFRYAVLASLHHADIPRHRYRAAKYAPWMSELNWDGITFPFTVSQLSLFEKRNPALSICLLQWKKVEEDDELVDDDDDEEVEKACLVRRAPLHPSRRVIHILLVGNHYVGVTSINRLLNSHNIEHGHHNRHYCERCLRPFFTTFKLDEHMPFCLRNEPQHYRMPEEKVYGFTHWGKTLSPSFVIYADIECLLEVGDGSTLQHHKPIASAFLVVANKALNIEPRYRSFVGRTCIPEFLKSLEEEVCAYLF